LVDLTGCGQGRLPVMSTLARVPLGHRRGKCLCAAHRQTVAGGSVSLAVCRRSWSPPPPTATKSPASPMHPKRSLAAGIRRQQRLAKSLSRKLKGSRNCRDAAAKLARHHHHVANVRRHFLHQVSGALVKTHDRLVIEDLNVTGMLRNHRLAQAVSNAGWAEFARLLGCKQAWRSGTIVIADRWYPSSKLCRACGAIRGDLTLADRVFTCGCGHSADRDANAGVNLAHWGQTHHDPHHDPRTPSNGAGPPMPADGTALTGTLRVPVNQPG
jgi:Putative transposase DNA-binding domain/Probable transposase